MTHRSFKNPFGFSLVEIIVAIGLVSILSLGIAQLMTNMTKSQQHLSQSFEHQKLLDDLRATISLSTTCAAALGLNTRTYVAPNTLDITAVNLPTTGAYTVGTPRDGIVIDQIRFTRGAATIGNESKPDPGAPATMVDYVRHPGVLSVSVAKASGSGSSGFSDFRARELPIIILTRAAAAPVNRIDYCYLSGQLDNATCTDMFGGEYNETGVPKCRLSRIVGAPVFSDDITFPGANTSAIHNSLSIFSNAGPSALILRNTTVGAAVDLTTGTAASVSLTAANALAITPPAGGQIAINNGGYTGAHFNALGIQVTRGTFPLAAGPLLNLQDTAANTAFTVTGNSTMTGRLTIAGPAAGAALIVTPGANQTALDVDGNTTFNGNVAGTPAVQIVGFTNTVGLGVTSGGGGANAISTTGNIHVNGILTATSDLRLKSDLEAITNPLAKLLSIRGLTYFRQDHEERQMGVIAQEVEKVFPEIVQREPSGYLSVDYSGLTAATIEAIKELKRQHDAEIKALREEIKSLRQEVKARSK